MRHGLLLINLGTPNSPDTHAVRVYLREFLTDKRVIDLPALIRYLLVYCLILPFRSKKSARAYQSIWTAKGSPLLLHSENIVKQLQQISGSSCKIALGMRYGTPSIACALEQLKDCDSITILPLYPQYSSAATGSAIELALNLIAKQEVIPSVTVIRDFYQHPDYIKAQAQIIKKHLATDSHLLFSYHGIPERQVHKSGCKTVCKNQCPDTKPRCYRAQCQQTSRLLAQELGLDSHQYETTFQSRLGKTTWIQPYTDEMLTKLAAKGIKKLTITCPSFVVDCLETLEEIGIRAKKQWLDLGGEEFTLVPCMNDDPEWIKTVSRLAQR